MANIGIAKEGIRYIILFLFLGGILIYFRPLLAAVPLAVAVFAMYFFRDPRRVPRCDESAVVSPADGRVVRIDEVAEYCYMGSQTRRVSIFMSLFDVHINYAPVSGIIDYMYYRKGSFTNALKDISSRVNENNTIGIKVGETVMAVRQIAGMIARRIVCRCAVGDRVRAGEKVGLIKFGSRVDLFLPLDARLMVNKGARVRGGETVIARLR